MKKALFLLTKFLYAIFGKQVLRIEDVQKNIDALGIKRTVTALDINEYHNGRFVLEVWIVEDPKETPIPYQDFNTLCKTLGVDAIFWNKDQPGSGYNWVILSL